MWYLFTTAKHKSDRVHLAPKCSINIFCWYTSVFSSPDNLRAAWWEGIWGGDICRPIQCGGHTHTHLWHPRRWEYKSLFLINLWFLFSINFWFIFNKFLIYVFNPFINVIFVLCRYLVETYYIGFRKHKNIEILYGLLTKNIKFICLKVIPISLIYDFKSTKTLHLKIRFMSSCAKLSRTCQVLSNLDPQSSDNISPDVWTRDKVWRWLIKIWEVDD